ncbi:MAG: hypothetical protein KDJ38_11870 [Gammaproteobacteria bacterium]|nr:hypothetical protein [Gammaproteobacteria bacterium]
MQSLFDTDLDRVHGIVHALQIHKGVFHAKIHYSSSQLTCWFASDPFVYQKFVREEVFEEGFVDRFPDSDHAGRQSLLSDAELLLVFDEFTRLRVSDETIYLRNAAVNLINGMINLSFSCDGTHYIDHKTFFSKLDNF